MNVAVLSVSYLEHVELINVLHQAGHTVLLVNLSAQLQNVSKQLDSRGSTVADIDSSKESLDLIGCCHCVVLPCKEMALAKSVMDLLQKQHWTIPVIVVAHLLSSEEKYSLLRVGIEGVVDNTYSYEALLDEVMFASIRFGHVKKESALKIRAQEQLEERIIIDRAKEILMQQGYSEQEAYIKLRSISMDERLPLRDIARSVLLHERIKEK